MRPTVRGYPYGAAGSHPRLLAGPVLFKREAVLYLRAIKRSKTCPFRSTAFSGAPQSIFCADALTIYEQPLSFLSETRTIG